MALPIPDGLSDNAAPGQHAAVPENSPDSSDANASASNADGPFDKTGWNNSADDARCGNQEETTPHSNDIFSDEKFSWDPPVNGRGHGKKGKANGMQIEKGEQKDAVNTPERNQEMRACYPVFPLLIRRNPEVTMKKTEKETREA